MKETDMAVFSFRFDLWFSRLLSPKIVDGFTITNILENNPALKDKL
jgi:hypothetical protein